jgi:hypothetical protein
MTSGALAKLSFRRTDIVVFPRAVLDPNVLRGKECLQLMGFTSTIIDIVRRCSAVSQQPDIGSNWLQFLLVFVPNSRRRA